MKSSTILFIFLLITSGPRALIGQDKGESDDDPGGRSQWEWLRLHDPATGQIPPNIRQQELEFAKTLPTAESRGPKSKGRTRQIEANPNWSARGPYNVGGRTRALAVDVTNSNVILAGGVSGGMWKSTDGGSTWKQKITSNQLHSATCIAQDIRSGKTNVWYYGTGEEDGNSADADILRHVAHFAGDGLFKSTNSGESWEPIKSTWTGTTSSLWAFNHIWRIAIDPHAPPNQNVVYVAAEGCILKSTNGGDNWTTCLGSISINGAVSKATDVAVTSDGVVYATLGLYSESGYGTPAQDAGFWRYDPQHPGSGPNGWAKINPPDLPPKYNRVVLAVAPSDQKTVYFLGDTPDAPSPPAHTITDTYLNETFTETLWKYEYKNGDGTGAGGKWTNASVLPNNSNISLPHDFEAYGSYNLALAVKPNDKNTLLVGGVGLYQITNGRNNCEDLRRYTLLHPDQHAIVFINPSTVLVGNDGGVYKADLASSCPPAWTSLNNGYVNSQFYSVAVDHGSTNDVIIGGLQDNQTWRTISTVPAASWDDIDPYGGDGASCAIADGGAYYYVSRQLGDIVREDVSGSYISKYTYDIQPQGIDYLWVTPFVLDPRDNKVMYLAGGQYLWRNSDATANDPRPNWHQLSNSSVSFPAKISALSMAGTVVHTDELISRIYYGTTDGQIFRMDEPGNSSSVPVPLTTPNLPAHAYVSCIAVYPFDANLAIVAFSNYLGNTAAVYLTTDAGSSWSAISGNLRGTSGYRPSCRWVSFGPSAGNDVVPVYLATSTGVYSTNFRFSDPTKYLNDNTTWYQEGSGSMGNVVVDMLDIRWTDGLIVAATHGNGVYSNRINVYPPVYIGQDKSTHCISCKPISWKDKVNQSHLVVMSLTDSNGMSVRLSSTDAHFALSPDSIYLPPGDSSVVTVSFTADSVGEYRTVIALDCGTFGQDSLPLSMEAVSSPYLVSRRSVDFGYLLHGSLRQDSIDLTSTNPDSMLLHLSTTGGDFSVSPPNIFMSPFQKRTIYLNYTASVTPGPSSGSFIIQADSSVGYDQSDTVSMIGTSTSSAFVVSPTSLHFDELYEGRTAAEAVDVFNASPSSNLAISSIVPSNGDFQVSPASGTIPPLSSLTVIASFEPTSPGQKSGQIIFSHNASPGFDTIQVNGTGLDSTMFRTFHAESLSVTTDHFGKYKSVKRKADKESFCLSLTKRTRGLANGLHIELSSPGIPGTFTCSPPISDITFNDKSVDVTFGDEYFRGPLDSGSTVNICGWAQKGKPVKLSKYWWTNQGVQVGAVLRTKSPSTSQVGLLPMPNLHNLGEAVFGGGGFAPTNGELIGLGGAHSVLLKKYSDVKKSLNKKGLLHTLGPKCLDQFDNGRLITKQLSSLAADKQDNALFAKQVALKLAVKASQMGFTPVGLGELRYDDSSANPLNGRTVDELIQITDSMLTLCSVSDPRITLLGVDSTIGIINAAFDGPIDTIHFAGGLVLKGVLPLAAVPYLQPSGFTPIRMQPRPGYQEETPREFTLDQNYPNPFNPTTVISFQLPVSSFVTLKIYNVLGQEVATVIDHELMDDGYQEAEFNAGGLASGVYFYRLTAEGFTDESTSRGTRYSQVRKLLLVK